MTDQIEVLDTLRLSVIHTEKKLNALNNWVYKKETDSYFGRKYCVNEHTRSFWKELKPVLESLYESQLLTGSLLDELYKHQGAE